MTAPDPALTFGRRHQRALDAIRTSIRHRGYPPTCRELAETLDVSSTSSVHYVLAQLEDLGRIRRIPGSGRAIEIVDDDAPEILGVLVPTTTELRAQVGLMQRLAESLLAGGRELRARDLHLAAAELEYAAQSLIAGADDQVRVLKEQAAARRGADGR